jgi:hypothetical protein
VFAAAPSRFLSLRLLCGGDSYKNEQAKRFPVAGSTRFYATKIREKHAFLAQYAKERINFIRRSPSPNSEPMLTLPK